MALRTIKDFDFGVGGSDVLAQRVASCCTDVSKIEVDFIVWLMLEQQFRKTKRRQRLTPQQQRRTSRTQQDGLHDDVDEDDGDDDGTDSSRPISFCDIINEKLRIAREYAEQTLREVGMAVLWEDLPEEDRHSMLIQLCRNSELWGNSGVRSVPDIFEMLRSSSRFNSRFNVIEPLAKGGFGEVFLVTEGNKHFAVKRVSVSPTDENDGDTMRLDEVKMAINESKILKTLKGHPNIVEVHNYWLEIEPTTETFSSSGDEYDDGPLKFYIQLEYCGQSLDCWKDSNYKRGVVPEMSQIVNMARQIFDGVAHIHKNKILHLDINPKNILWKDPSCTQLKIVDFGLAVKGLVYNERTGTAVYTAPEMPLTQKSDVYSSAVTIVEVGKTIYTKNELCEIVREMKVDTEIPILNDLLSRALICDPSERPTAGEIVETLTTMSE